MHSTKIIAASAALVTLASAQSSCSRTITIESAEPTTYSCSTVRGIEIAEDVTGSLEINGIEEIEDDFIANNVTGLISLSSSTLTSVGGSFELIGLRDLQSINFPELREVSGFHIETLPSLSDIQFGSGVTQAEEVRVTDTRIGSLSGLTFTSVDTMRIDNNYRLSQFDSGLVNVTGTLEINRNGRDMEVILSSLENAGEIQLRNVGRLQLPLLENLTGGLNIDNCDFANFEAPNLTEVGTTVAFINNRNLANVSLPALLTIGGDLRAVNNTNLRELRLNVTEVESINCGGPFEVLELDNLEQVRGTVDVSSTEDDDSVCDSIQEAYDNDVITGEFQCTVENENANEGGDSDGGRDGGSGSDDDDDDAAGIVSVNSALLGLALVAGIAQLL